MSFFAVFAAQAEPTGWQLVVMADFSHALNDDQLQIEDWIHQFAVDTIRPAAHEWDEKEEFPWPTRQV